MQSARAIVAGSCSTTITVLPVSRSRRARRGAARDRARGVRCTARRARRSRHWRRRRPGRESDALRLATGKRRRRAIERQVAEPDLLEEREPLRISFTIGAPMRASSVRERAARRTRRESIDGHAVRSEMLRPRKSTARAIGFSRGPRHVWAWTRRRYTASRSRCPRSATRSGAPRLDDALQCGYCALASHRVRATT